MRQAESFDPSGKTGAWWHDRRMGAVVARSSLPPPLSFPAKAGNPVRRGVSVSNVCLWNTGSPAPVRNRAQGGRW